MKCTICQGERFKTTHEDRVLSNRSLPDVVIVDLRKDTCLDCGEYEIEFPQHSRLLEVVATALINKKQLLAPGEIRWLRDRLGFTATHLAEILKVSATTISYWENGQRKPSPTADLALRLLVMFTLPQGSFSPAAAPGISVVSHAPLQLRLQFDGSDWRMLESELILVDHEAITPLTGKPIWGPWPIEPVTTD